MRRPNDHAAAALLLAAGMLAGLPSASAGSGREAEAQELKVCADPNNMPFSRRDGAGFENRLAEMVARDLGRTVSYTWWPQRRGFLRNTLKAERCDVVMGIPALDMLGPTRPYYSSSYVLVSRKAEVLDFSSIQAPELRDLTIGVHLIGEDGANTPAAHVLGQEGIVDNVVGYPIYGDYRDDAPPSELIRDVAKGKIDVAFAWGPLAGYYARHSQVPLRVVPVTGTESYLPLVFQYSIGMAVRKKDHVLRGELNNIIIRRHPEINALLDEYGVPRI